MSTAPSKLTQQAVEEYQAFICQLEGVINTHFVLSDNGEVEELHVLATTERNAKQLVRDIQSALMARYHLDIDHRVISIAQIPQPAGPAQAEPASQPRLVCKEVSTATSRDQTRIEITLSYRDELFCGQATGSSNPHSRHRLVCQAVLDAVHRFINDEAAFSLVDIRLVDMSGHTVALVSVAMRQSRREELLLGAAYDDDDVSMAITKATLDAINRRLTLFSRG